MIQNDSFCIKDKDIRFYIPKVDEDFIHKLEGLSEVGHSLREIGCRILTPFRELTNGDKAQLDLLVHIKKEINVFNTDKKIFVYNWTFHDKVFPFIIEKDNGIKLIEYMFSRTLRLSYGSPKEDAGGHPVSLLEDAYRVPNYVKLTFDQLANLYYYDYEAMFDQVEMTVVNKNTEDALHHIVLSLLGAYDISGNEKLLKVANVLADRLIDVFPNEPTIRINGFQIEKRLNDMLSNKVNLLQCWSEVLEEVMIGMKRMMRRERLCCQ